MDLEIHKVQKDLKKLHRKIVDLKEVWNFPVFFFTSQWSGLLVKAEKKKVNIWDVYCFLCLCISYHLFKGDDCIKKSNKAKKLSEVFINLLIKNLMNFLHTCIFIYLQIKKSNLHNVTEWSRQV